MLIGHVDVVTLDEVSGWAGDDLRPEQAVHVSIFVDGIKVGDVLCDIERPDLVAAGVFSDPRHGYHFVFPTRLNPDHEKRVWIRHSATGKLLRGGNVFFDKHAERGIRLPPPDNVGEPALPVPRKPRQLFETLALYRPEDGLYDLLSRIKFSNKQRSEILFAALGTTPETIDDDPNTTGTVTDQPYFPRDHMYSLLQSPRFQAEVVSLFLEAFPEMTRQFFIHIPKCAGTDLSFNLMQRFPTLHQTLMEPSWTSQQTLFHKLSRLAQHIRFFDTLFVCGHSRLNAYADRGLIRPFDTVFTVLREPAEMVLSQVNYILTRFKHDQAEGILRPDTTEWLALLGMREPPSDYSPQSVRELARLIIRSPKLVGSNAMCYWLGGSDASTALAALIRHRVEITTARNYNSWLRWRWDINTKTRSNQSEHLITLDQLGDNDQSYVHDIITEDTKLYATVTESLKRTGKPSITGDEIGAYR